MSEVKRLGGRQGDDERLLDARIQLAKQDPAVALDLLGAMHEEAGQAAKSGLLVCIDALRAMCHLNLADGQAASAALDAAIRRAVETGQRRIFLENLPGLRGLLAEARVGAPHFVGELLSLAEAGRKVDPAAARELAEPLSPTQLRVLALLNRGLTNQEIAEELRIGVGTIRWHLNHIFGKLQVRNRTEAVVRARETGLL
jgi:LuxR family maltose regulon positive regulatory protein